MRAARTFLNCESLPTAGEVVRRKLRRILSGEEPMPPTERSRCHRSLALGEEAVVERDGKLVRCVVVVRIEVIEVTEPPDSRGGDPSTFHELQGM